MLNNFKTYSAQLHVVLTVCALDKGSSIHAEAPCFLALISTTVLYLPRAGKVGICKMPDKIWMPKLCFDIMISTTAAATPPAICGNNKKKK
eukprot:3474068-Amphidinium_carterae.1